MQAAEACELADLILARAGLTPEGYAEAKGVTVAGVPSRLLWTEDEAAQALAVSKRTLRRMAAEDERLASCQRNLRAVVRWHAGDLAAWTNRTPN